MNAAEVFLRALFGAAPPEYFILVWTLPDKRSQFFNGVTEELLAYVEHAKTRGDVYVGVGLRKEARGVYQRGKASEVVVLLGLWADLDFAGDGHKKPGLPASLEEVQEFAEALPVRPTMLVNTGGGLHCWWLFKEPWDITADREREDALDLVWRWQQTIKDRARRRGRELTGYEWSVDSVHDLARVLRVPGTQNRKIEPYRDVVFVREPDERLRYDPSEFDPFLIDCGKAPQDSADPTLHIDASLPPLEGIEGRWPIRKWMALCKNDPKFKTTWEGNRRDIKDGSPSGYDLALANFMVKVEWTDQEIVDALIFRRKDRQDGLKRLDYYAYTIKKAREARYAENAVTYLKEDIAAGKVEDPLMAISDHLGIRLLRVTRLKSSTPTFLIDTELGKMQELAAKQIQIFATFQAEMAGHLKHTIPQKLKKDWGEIWMLIIKNAIDDEDFQTSANEEALVRERIEAYLAENGPMPDIKEAITQDRPLIKAGTVWIYGGNFRTWVSRKQDETINQHEFGRMMHLYGAKSAPQDVSIHGARTTRMYWYLPRNDFVKELVATILESPSHSISDPISEFDPHQEQTTGGVNGTNGRVHAEKSDDD